MASSSDLLVWIDCEMTGLDVSIDELVEVAVVITDYDLNAVDPGFQRRDQARPGRTRQHGRVRDRDASRVSGLLDEIPNGRSLADAEFAVNEYILGFVPTPQSAPLAGNTDRHRPRLPRQVHAAESTRTCTTAASTSPRSKSLLGAGSRACTSTRPSRTAGTVPSRTSCESIRELAYYRAAAFVPEPGPIDRTGAGHLGGDRDEVRRDAVIHWTSLRRSAWWS